MSEKKNYTRPAFPMPFEQTEAHGILGGEAGMSQRELIAGMVAGHLSTLVDYTTIAGDRRLWQTKSVAKRAVAIADAVLDITREKP